MTSGCCSSIQKISFIRDSHISVSIALLKCGSNYPNICFLISVVVITYHTLGVYLTKSIYLLLLSQCRPICKELLCALWKEKIFSLNFKHVLTDYVVVQDEKASVYCIVSVGGMYSFCSGTWQMECCCGRLWTIPCWSAMVSSFWTRPTNAH